MDPLDDDVGVDVTGENDLLNDSSRIGGALESDQLGEHDSASLRRNLDVGSTSGTDSDSAAARMGIESTIQQHLQQLAQSDFSEVSPLTLVQSRTQASIAQSLSNRLLSSAAPLMSQQAMLSLKRNLPLDIDELPRKKSRNYLDSHKNIEKRRRDRINNSLFTLKTLVPDCKQYGNKKLDKAEILEMTIEYIQRMQNQGLGKSGSHLSGFDLALAQREWASELTAWVIQNKLLFYGNNALDQFTNSLLLHLQNFGNAVVPQNQLQSTTNLLQSVASSTSEETSIDPVYRQILLQQLHSSNTSQSGQGLKTGSRNGSTGQTSSEASQPPNNSQVQQHLQAIVLLQQQQQQLQTSSDSNTQDQHTQQQIQQLQSLQLLIAQHLTSEGMSQKLSMQQLGTLLQLLQHQQQPQQKPEEDTEQEVTTQASIANEPSDLTSLALMPSIHKTNQSSTSKATLGEGNSMLLLQDSFIEGNPQKSPPISTWTQSDEGQRDENELIDLGKEDRDT